MTFFQMRCFLSLAKTRKMSVTAAAMGLSLSTLSKHIDRMEDELSVMLFSKRQHRAALTREGEMIFPSIEYIVKRHTEQCAEIEKSAVGSRTTTSIAMAYHQRQIVRRLIKLMEMEPTVELNLTEASASEVCTMLDDKIVDIGIVYDELIDKKYPISMTLRRDQIVAVVSTGHPLAGKGIISVNDLRNETFFLFKGDHLMYQYQLQLCISAGFVPNEIHGDMRMSTILLSVAAGSGVSLLVQNTVNTLNIDGVVVLELEEKPRLTMRAYAASVYLLETQRKVLEFLRTGSYSCK